MFPVLFKAILSLRIQKCIWLLPAQDFNYPYVNLGAIRFVVDSDLSPTQPNSSFSRVEFRRLRLWSVQSLAPFEPSLADRCLDSALEPILRFDRAILRRICKTTITAIHVAG